MTTKNLNLTNYAKNGALSGKQVARLVLKNLEEEVAQKKPFLTETEIKQMINSLKRPEGNIFNEMIKFFDALYCFSAHLEEVCKNLYINMFILLPLAHDGKKETMMNLKTCHQKLKDFVYKSYREILFLHEFIKRASNILGVEQYEKNAQENLKQAKTAIHIYNARVRELLLKYFENIDYEELISFNIDIDNRIIKPLIIEEIKKMKKEEKIKGRKYVVRIINEMEKDYDLVDFPKS